MRAPRSVVAVIVIVAAFAARSAAQTAVISGTVYRDSAGHQLAAAEILLPDLNRRVSANWAGEFKFAQLPGGRHAIVIRHLGFTPLTDTIEVANGATIDVIQGHVPGVSTFNVKGAGSIVGEYLASGRKCGTGPTLLSCKGGPQPCPVTLYLDGIVVYDAARDDFRQMPDLSRYNTRDYAAVEYYAGGASMPVKYNATSSGCGVLLLWTRER